MGGLRIGVVDMEVRSFVTVGARSKATTRILNGCVCCSLPGLIIGISHIVSVYRRVSFPVTMGAGVSVASTCEDTANSVCSEVIRVFGSRGEIMGVCYESGGGARSGVVSHRLIRRVLSNAAGACEGLTGFILSGRDDVVVLASISCASTESVQNCFGGTRRLFRLCRGYLKGHDVRAVTRGCVTQVGTVDVATGKRRCFIPGTCVRDVSLLRSFLILIKGRGLCSCPSDGESTACVDVGSVCITSSSGRHNGVTERFCVSVDQRVRRCRGELDGLVRGKGADREVLSH